MADYISVPEYALGNQSAPDRVGTQVYRFAKISSGQYFYKGSAAEKNSIIASEPGFRYEGPVFNAQDNWVTSYSPVYRFSNILTGGYFYTASSQERDSVFSLYSNYRYEGASFFASTSPSAETAPVYRLANTLTVGYLFTSSVVERTFAGSLGYWRDEGIAFYSPKQIAFAGNPDELVLATFGQDDAEAIDGLSPEFARPNLESLSESGWLLFG